MAPKSKFRGTGSVAGRTAGSVTDRQMDEHTDSQTDGDGIYRASIALHGKYPSFSTF